jgi:DNA modification methylase
MSKTKQVKITPAKGRPMLTWVGKRPLKAIQALPAQHVETFDPADNLGKKKPGDVWADWPSDYPKGGLLFHGDNKEVLTHLLASGFRGKINLIYIDPPFDSGADYVRKVQLRGVKGAAKIDGEEYTLGEQVQYTDIWANDNYLQFMYERLLLLKELLADEGSVWVHCDPNRSHYLRIILDEVFGPSNFVNEISWNRSAPKGLTGNQFPDNHDSILYFCKDRSIHKWQKVYGTYNENHLAKFRYIEKESGRKYMLDNLQNPNPNRPNLTYEWRGNLRCWRWTRERMEKALEDGLIEHTSSGMPYLKRYLDELKGPTITDIWTDIAPINSQALERANYPTQKPEKLIDRIFSAATREGDLVLDCFLGSGTTAAVAQKQGCRWIACDINKGAVQTASKRLQAIITEQIAEAKKPKQEQLTGMETEGERRIQPAQIAFTVWRVNDYDLQIQHNEAVDLACDYIGVERKRSDTYFDGILGKKLVKIIPFNHPLSPLDLEELKRELNARPDEDRDIVLVCLGMELAAQSWVAEWNKLRGEGVPNRIELIELRTDPKYAGFFRHDPATAKVRIQRKGNKISVKIENFISPTVIKRLDMEESLFKAKITDWRSQVDCVTIDSNYNGQVFNVALSDVPAKKNDLVNGVYDLLAPKNPTNVAVKIIDMLGEEVLIVKKV